MSEPNVPEIPQTPTPTPPALPAPSSAKTPAPAAKDVAAAQPSASNPPREHPELTGYKLIQELGKSPRGTVYKARRQVEQDIVALKIIRSSSCDKNFVENLARRAEATFLLEHENLVKCLGCNTVSGRTVLVMSFAPGQPVSRTLKKNGRFQPSQALIIALQCVTALRYAAQHKCHHNRLHPADIILGEDHARVVGVGLGERAEHPAWEPGKAPYLFEPLIYTAPEAMPSKPLLEKPEARCAADIYSLGAILFHMLTGMPPFNSSEETALLSERERLNIPVAWPRQMTYQLPKEVISLTEKMMSPNPANRPAYEQLVPALTVSIPIAEQLEPPQRKISPAISALNAVGATGSRSKVPVVPAAAPAAQPAAVQAASGVSVLDFPTARGGSAAERRALKSARAEKFFTMVLVGVTVIVFLFAASLAVERFIYEPSRQTAVVQVQPPKPEPLPPAPAPIAEQKTVVTAEAVPPKEPAPPPASQASGHPSASASQGLADKAGNDDYAAAARQVELIREMLKTGQVAPSAALLRLVRGLVEKAGHDTPAGVNALVLATEIEDSIVHKYYAQGQNGSALQPPAPAPAMPGTQDTKPAATLEKSPATPDPKDSAAKFAEQEKQRHAYDAPIQSALAKVRKYQYASAKQDLDEIAGKADGEGKATVQAAQEFTRLETELFEHCRAHLKSYIEKDAQHASMLQVYPRKNDSKGDDIVDIDDKGLKIVTKRAGSETSRVREWEKVSATNGFKMFQLLSDKKSVDEQLGLAAFAATRGMRDEFNSTLEIVRSLPTGKEKADTINQQIDLLAKILQAQ